MIHLSDLRCAKCGTEHICCIAPGEDEVRDLFLLVRQTPPRALCVDCWPALAVEKAE
jgi:hypothetical protein